MDNASVPIMIVRKLLGNKHLNPSMIYTEISSNYIAMELKKAFKGAMQRIDQNIKFFQEFIFS